MMHADESIQRLERDILSRFDSNGFIRHVFESFYPVLDEGDEDESIKVLLSLAGIDDQHIRYLYESTMDLIRSTAQVVLIFSPLGWAPSKSIPADVYKQAITLLEVSGDVELAQDVLVRGWNEPYRLENTVRGLASLGFEHKPLAKLMHHRSRLVRQALKHHRDRAFEASVPIILSQVDGIVYDFTENRDGFFSRKKDGGYLTDNSTVAGLDQGLKQLRNLFSQSMTNTGVTGELSRHGILHGRELGYDTEINSTKAFVLLASIIEWAEPRAKQLAERLEFDRLSTYTGTNEVDEDGMRQDNAGFKDAKQGLTRLSVRMAAEHRKHGRYSNDVAAMLPGDLVDRLLHGKSGIHIQVAEDGQQYWAWKSTPSGFCFGIAGSEGNRSEWHYAGMSPPAGGIDSSADWRGLFDDMPPDWL